MKVTRATELVGVEVPDPAYPEGEGRTVTQWSIEYVPITVGAYKLKKKYR